MMAQVGLKKRKSKYGFDQSEACFKQFQDSISSEDTKYVWVNYLHNYMTFHKMDKYSDMLHTEVKLVQSRLIEYIQEKKKTVRSQSIGSQLTALKHFYFMNDYEGINWDKVRYFLGESIRAVEDKPYTHEQIHNLIEHCNPKIRIVVYSEAQGGPRIGSFPAMNVGDIEKNEYGFYRAWIYRGTKESYMTFFGPEATKEIDAYLDYRRRCGEVITPESPLIREEFKAHDKLKIEHPRRLSKRTLERQIGHAAQKAGLRTINKGVMRKRKETMLTHGLRKFFKQQCRRAKVDPIVIEWLVGHRNGDLKVGISKLMITYDPAVEDELLQEYLKAIDYLTINEENRLKRKNQQLQQKHEEDREEIGKLWKAHEELSKQIQSRPPQQSL